MKTFGLITLSLILLGAGCASAPEPTAPSAPAPAATSPVPPTDLRIDRSGEGLTSFPMEILDMDRAVELNLSDNRLTGAMPAEIRHLSRLKVLNASGNLMTGVPAEIGQLSDLEILDLSDNLLTGLPHELGGLSSLKILNLRGNDVSKTDLEIIRASLPSQARILTDQGAE